MSLEEKKRYFEKITLDSMWHNRKTIKKTEEFIRKNIAGRKSKNGSWQTEAT